MPLRIGANGAVTEPYSTSASQAIARTTARRVIDVMRDSDEESGDEYEEESVNEAPEPLLRSDQ